MPDTVMESIDHYIKQLPQDEYEFVRRAILEGLDAASRRGYVQGRGDAYKAAQQMPSRKLKRAVLAADQCVCRDVLSHGENPRPQSSSEVGNPCPNKGTMRLIHEWGGTGPVCDSCREKCAGYRDYKSMSYMIRGEPTMGWRKV